MEKKHGLQITIERNRQYFGHHKAVKLLLIVVMVFNVVLFICLDKVWSRKLPPRYIVTQPNGDYQQQCNVAKVFSPNSKGQCTTVCCQSTRLNQVQAWTSKAVTQLWNLDFINYRSQLNDVSRYFTKRGWARYLVALKYSDDYKVVSTSCANSSSPQCNGIIAPLDSGDGTRPVTVFKPESMGLIDGRQTWRVLAAFNIGYDYGAGGFFKQNYYATIFVVRAPVQNHPNRLAISNVHVVDVTKSLVS
jgi:hypothetical protein